jgi:glycosyltransferase involved in cell wall biosynthesis
MSGNHLAVDITVARSLGDTPKHVLYLIDSLIGVNGGAEGTVLKLTRSMPAERYRCTVVTFKAAAGIRDNFPCPFHVLPLQRTYDWNAVQQALTLSRLIRSQRFDLVHTFFSTADLWGGLIAKLCGAPLLISSRRDMGILRSPMHKVAYRAMSRMFDQVQMVSNKVREKQITEDHLDPQKAVTVYNGVDLDAIDQTPPLSAEQASDLRLRGFPIITTVANLRQVKGIDVLIRAVPLILQRFPSAQFLIVGETQSQSYLEELERLSLQLGVRNQIRFLGARSGVFSLLKISDVFCLPSRSEGLSNALLEAMACRLPCVATDVGGNAEVIEVNGSGLLVPSDRYLLLSEAIVHLLNDRETRRKMGERGRAIVEEKFTLRRMIQRYLEIYDQLTQAKSTNWISTISKDSPMWPGIGISKTARENDNSVIGNS